MTTNKQRQRRRNQRLLRASQSQDITFAGGGFEIQASDSGKSPSVDLLAYSGGLLRLPNFPHPVVIDMAGVKAMVANTNPPQLPILRDHDQKRPLGHGQPIITATNLKHVGVLSHDGAERQSVVSAAAEGFKWQASVGGSIPNRSKQVKTFSAGQTVKVNGQEFPGPVHLVQAFLWKETSVVALGADENRASASVAAGHNHKGKKMDEFERWLEACGIDSSTLDDSQVANLRAAHEATVTIKQPKGKGNDEGGDVQVMLKRAVEAAVKASREDLQNTIRADKLFRDFRDKVDSKKMDEVQASYSSGTISEDRAHLLLLQASREAETKKASMSNRPSNPLILEAALCRAAQVPEETIAASFAQDGMAKDAIERVINESNGQRYRQVGIKRVIAAACAQAGHSLCDGIIDNDAIRAAFVHAQNAQNMIQADGEFSTISLPNILSRVANKAMLASYDEAGDMGAIFEVAGVTSTSDFKTFERYRMTEAGTMTLVPATGEVPHGSFGEEMYQNKVDTYGKTIGLSRTMMINDDLNAFLQAPRLVGRMGRHALEQIGFAVLLDAPTNAAAGTTEFFHGAARATTTGPSAGALQTANYMAGATTALSIDSLAVANQMFLDQVDADGKPIMVSPSILLVTTTNDVMAGKLYRDVEYRFTNSANVKETINNQWQGKFKPVTAAYLSRASATTANNNALAWYLLSKPMSDMSALQIAFLNGVRTPIIEQGTMDFTVLGVMYRGYFDFGVALQDPRLIVKSKGF